jgi:multidrug efflux pump subunit AcrA (membrane-fusion protein)
MAKWIIAAVCFLVLVLIGALIFFGVQTQVLERSFEVRRGSLGRSARGLGKVETVVPTTGLGFTLSGRVARVLAAEGQKVQ